MKQTIKKIIQSGGKSAVLVAFGFALAAGTVVLAYTAPTATAPAGNVPAPVNTGTFPQSKRGSLEIGNALDAANQAILSVPFWTLGGNAIFTKSFTGGITDGSGNIKKGITVSPSTGGTLITNSNTANLQSNDQGTLIVSTDKLAGAPVIKSRYVGTDFATLLNAKSNTGELNIFTKAPTAGVFANTNGVTLATQNTITDEIQVTAGNPAAGKILTAKNNAGVAQWSDAPTATTLNSNGGLIRVVKSSASTNSAANVYCGADNGDDQNWIVIGGGGYCEYGTQRSEMIAGPSRQLSPLAPGTYSSGAGIGWWVDCLDKNGSNAVGTVVGNGGNPGAASAEVICMKKTPLVTGLVTTATTPVGTLPGGTTRNNNTWKSVSGTGYLEKGTNGQTCLDWVQQKSGWGPNSTNPVTINNIRIFNSATGGYSVGQCSYNTAAQSQGSGTKRSATYTGLTEAPTTDYGLQYQ